MRLSESFTIKSFTHTHHFLCVHLTTAASHVMHKVLAPFYPIYSWTERTHHRADMKQVLVYFENVSNTDMVCVFETELHIQDIGVGNT